MANTRQSAKRVRLENKRKIANRAQLSSLRTTIKTAVDAIQKAAADKDVAKGKAAYMAAVKSLSRAGGRGTVPANRAARKTSRLTHFVKRTLPEVLQTR